jgi:very-short-patch-repair endonuclease
MAKLQDTSNRLYHYGAKPQIFQRAQDLRKQTTEAEELLWKRLRGRRFEGLKFRRQYPMSRFIVDFYCHKKLLVVEVDGGIHDEPEVKECDEGREEELKNFGLTIVRFKNEEVINDMNGVLGKLRAVVKLA